MTGEYVDFASKTSMEIAQFLRDRLPNRQAEVRDVDRDVQGLLRRIGQGVVEALLNWAGEEATQGAREEGFRIESHSEIEFLCLFGPVRVRSTYLRDRETGRSIRPLKEALEITHRGRSQAVERALADFGSEESFGQGADRFQEHYGWSVNRTTLMRVTKQRAQEAERYVQSRLDAERSAFEEPLRARPGADQVLVELDGCAIRTGTLEPSPGSETTPVRGLPRGHRVQEWREVRVGLTRRLEEERPTYVAEMASYPDVVWSLFSAATSHGLSTRTETIAVADGGNGLKEELEVQFPRLTFILDRPHVQKHLYETAEAMGLDEEGRGDWVRRQIKRIDEGTVRMVIGELRQHKGQGHDRARQLAGYLSRFRDCVHYSAYKARGLPIGSGEVESAHRSIPQKRLKLPGACWKPETINPILALRLIRANGWWEHFWTAQPAA